MIKFLKFTFCFFLLLFLAGGSFWFFSVRPKTPSNDRNWSTDQAVLPEIAIEGDSVSVKNIRNFSYTSETEYTPRYYDRTFPLSEVETAWYMVEPLSKIGIAHTLVSFGLRDGSYLSVSIEIRKEKGEIFSPLRGLLREYELMYVIADEQDVIKLRSNYRHDDVYLYKLNLPPEKVREYLVSLLQSADDFRAHPRFYNTLTHNCTSELVSHANILSPGRIPWSIKTLLPTYSAKLAYDLGLLDRTLSFEELEQKSHINERALKYAADPDFSRRIRE